MLAKLYDAPEPDHIEKMSIETFLIRDPRRRTTAQNRMIRRGAILWHLGPAMFLSTVLVACGILFYLGVIDIGTFALDLRQNFTHFVTVAIFCAIFFSLYSAAKPFGRRRIVPFPDTYCGQEWVKCIQSSFQNHEIAFSRQVKRQIWFPNIKTQRIMQEFATLVLDPDLAALDRHNRLSWMDITMQKSCASTLPLFLAMDLYSICCIHDLEYYPEKPANPFYDAPIMSGLMGTALACAILMGYRVGWRSAIFVLGDKIRERINQDEIRNGGHCYPTSVWWEEQLSSLVSEGARIEYTRHLEKEIARDP